MPQAPFATCVPAGLDGADWSQIEPVLTELQHREVASPEEFERWLIDRSELEAACDEARANLYIASSCDTESKPKSEAFASFVENIAPRLETIGFELDRRQVALAERFRPDPARYAVLERSKRARVELFRAENVPLQTDLDKLSQEFARIAGAQTVEFDGQERTLPQMGAYLLDPDRARREAAWRGINTRRLADREALDALLDRMVALRDRTARNAACAGFVEYTFKDKLRFDYTPADCERFAGSVERRVMPLVRRLTEKRRVALGVAELRPWDLAVDVKGRPGLRPFNGGRDLFAKTAAVFDTLDARLGRMFRDLGPGPDAPRAAADPKALVSECLDLDSRKGKRPGGYQYNRARSRRPFIFMNAAGLQRDVMTMVHEAGHAFHSMLCAPEPLADYRHSPTEFAEVASMSMEHLTMPHWGGGQSGKPGRGGYFTNPEELRRAQAEHLERCITILPWIATIDSFQRWMYAHPAHTHRQRDDHWLELDGRFGEPVSWAGFDDERRSQWQKQSHIFSHPLYYIEYGIAELGSLQLWLKSRREGERAAIDAYIKALSLGGSRPLPDLFAAAGIEFDFGESTIACIVEAVETELERIGG